MSASYDEIESTDNDATNTELSSDTEYYDSGWEDESDSDEGEAVAAAATRKSRRIQSAGFNDMPRELLIEIFTTAHDSFGTFQDCTWDALPPGLSHAQWEKDTISFILTICSVCWKWREIALSATELWSRISLARMSGPMYELVCERLVTFVERSGTRPLELFIAQCDNKEDETSTNPSSLQPLWGPAAQILITQIDRCSSFHYYSADHKPTLLPLPGRLEHLVELNVHISAATPTLCILGSENEARLQKFKASVFSGIMSPLFDHINGAGITDLALRLPAINGFLHDVAPVQTTGVLTATLISRCPNVSRLAITSNCRPERPFPPSTFPHLSYLTVSDSLSISFGKYIPAPVLTHLTLTYGASWGVSSPEDYPTTFPLLKSLEIRGMKDIIDRPPRLHRLIRRQPNLRTITVSWTPYYDVILFVRLLLNDEFRPWMTLRADPGPQDWEGPFLPELACVRLTYISHSFTQPGKDELSGEISNLMERRGQLRFELDSTVFKKFPQSVDKLKTRWGDRVVRMPGSLVEEPKGGWVMPE